MARIDLYLSNPNHHAATIAPVARELLARGADCRVLSLCGLRGLPQPGEAIAACGAPLLPVGPERRPRAADAALGDGRSRRRALSRAVAWRALLAPALSRARADRASLAAVPNDAAYPYDRIVRWLSSRGVPTVLLQEGIRFPLPTERASAYGGAADAIAAWGDGSASHFLAAGVDEERIHVTGSPRFEGLSNLPPAAGRDLALITNPIDAQGLCSTTTKHELVARFARALPPGREVFLRCHAGERAGDYLAAVAPDDRSKLRPTEEGSLSELLERVRGVVILASTVGVEALLAGRGVGVLACPGRGHLFDYVERGVAVPLFADAGLAGRLDAVIDTVPDREEARRDYLDYHLAHRGEAARRVASLIMSRSSR